MNEQQELAVRPQTAIERYKTCTKCATPKPLGSFYENKKQRGGRNTECKECAKTRVKAARARNIEHYREFDKRRASLPHRVLARKEYQRTLAGKKAFYNSTRNQHKRYPEKVRARLKLNRAVKSGKIVKQPCEVCGNREVNGHHDDYSKPLEVRWLCMVHHKQVHGYMQEKTA